MEYQFCVKKVFLERSPEKVSETRNPYVAAQFYKDLASSDLSLYTKRDYTHLSKLFASAAIHNGFINALEVNGFIVTITFVFKDKGNLEEFIENLKEQEIFTVLEVIS